MRLCMVTRYRKLENQLAALAALGFSPSNIVSHQGRSALLKPLFLILRDDTRKTLTLLIRGTTSIKDAFTSLTGTSKPHHVVGNTGVVLGWSHFGMLASARWIHKKAVKVLNEFLAPRPDWRLQIVGHSLGGGTAALLCMMCDAEFITRACS
jgi:hypothetical protein